MKTLTFVLLTLSLLIALPALAAESAEPAPSNDTSADSGAALQPVQSNLTFPLTVSFAEDTQARMPCMCATPDDCARQGCEVHAGCPDFEDWCVLVAPGCGFCNC
ncbi:MAG: hypothetical protein AAGN66_05215 [Acidobacteriota bacterium]